MWGNGCQNLTQYSCRVFCIQERDEKHASKGLEEKEVSSESELTSFLLKLDVLSLIKDFHVVVRFKAACKEAQNVDGKVAWTTTRTKVDVQSRLISLAYRTKEGSSVKEEFVPVASLEPCLPNLRDDSAVVLTSELKGTDVYPSHSHRDNEDIRSEMYCLSDQHAHHVQGAR